MYTATPATSTCGGGDVIVVIISFWIDLFYFQSLQQGKIVSKIPPNLSVLLLPVAKNVAPIRLRFIYQHCVEYLS